MTTDKTFEWTDELVLLALDLAHHNGYHKFNQRCVDLFDEVKKQAMQSGYKYPSWITDHVEASKEVKKEKDYEIIAYRNKNDGGIDNVEAYIKSIDPKWYLDDREWEIYSVRRLSDNEVFTIGDKTEKGNIIGFGFYDDGSICIDTCTDGKYHNRFPLWTVKKEVKKPLFTTFDCKDIYFMGKFWAVTDDWDITFSNATQQINYPNRTFSTKDAAISYVVWNKSMLSVAEVMSITEQYGTWLDETQDERIFKRKRLIQLAQQKLQL